MAAPILDLSTLAPERPTVVINRQPYELRMPDDFGLIELARYERLMHESQAIQNRKSKAPITVDEAQKLSTVLAEAVQLVLQAPADVLAELSDWNRIAILEAFTPAVTGAATPRKKPRSRSTSGRSSRASRASTAPATG